MHTGMVNGLRGFAVNEFDAIVEERRVVEGLNRLEDLIADAKRRKARGVEGEEGVVPYVVTVCSRRWMLMMMIVRIHYGQSRW